ncbi:dynamin family protein [Alicyclobacillus kakegawensis]|uniref:dynamin family protein n=1 Tax=Alicyclobacillus kakegawensis TaxID=392012 RepID=UPI000832F1CA|nr:dynamin family protein [Alicyclobacillus kakegawensis]
MTRGMQRLRARVEAAGDVATAEKLVQLAARAEVPEQVVIAFVGLFSAGKSSLINHLCGSPAMATGAVPTTAQVTGVELPGTEGRVRLLDTPGIDSTDDAHQQATQAALYQADVVCLVMDYQHVESDANLEWAYQLSGSGKRLALIVNQIDKHLEWEIPFATFVERIQTTLTDWEIEYERLFFVSSRNHPSNQVEDLRRWLAELADGASQSQLEHRALELIEEHLNWRYSAIQQQHAMAVRKVLALPPEVDVSREVDVSVRLGQLHLQLSQVQQKIQEGQDALADTSEQFLSRLLREIELAQVAPYETTEKGRLFVESLRPGFRVGWLRSAERTAAERQRRLAAFRADLTERSEKYLLWPVQTHLREFAAAARWADDETKAAVDNLRVSIEDEWLRQLVRQGALVSEQYPYQYVKDVVGALRADVRAQVKALVERWQQQAVAKLNEEVRDLRREGETLTEKIAVLEAWQALCAERAEAARELRGLLDDPPAALTHSESADGALSSASDTVSHPDAEVRIRV